MKEIVQFLHEVRLEFSKVIWPKSDEFIGSTVIVLFLVLIFAIYLGVIDWVFTEIVKYIFRAYVL